MNEASLKLFDERAFRERVNAAIERIRTILDNSKNPQYPSEVHHEYDDKFLLADTLTNSAIASVLNCLGNLGLNEKSLEKVKAWAETRSVTLRFRAEQHCKFARKVEREEKSDTTQVSTSTVFGTSKHYTVTKITEYFWTFDAQWELVAFVGNEDDKGIPLRQRSGTVEIKTTVDETPRPVNVVKAPLDVNITWLLNNLRDDGTAKFSINRKEKQCRTPRRNNDIYGALSFMKKLHHWAGEVHSYFTRDLFPVQSNHGLDLNAINESSIFVPVLPLFEKARDDSSASASSSAHQQVLPPQFMNAFLGEQTKSMGEKMKDLAKVFPAGERLITVAEAQLLVTLLHSKRIGESHSEGVDCIEFMLHSQLVAAIGKEVTPVDFTNYMTYHNRKLYRPQYQPRLFCYAVRRPEHYPEGTLTIEAQLDDGALADPITTVVSHSIARSPMQFSINASTQVSFYGERFLHGFVSHQFSGYSGAHLSLVARARQLSSFILLVGRIASADLFEPKYAIIIQNKDELKIPLMLETIPTPKEFKDAIESLSPEQQRFAKAIRSMQLESTLFGICIVQIKPQLEKLLKLPDDSLTKEIQLTQDLLTLFIDYQIPSDLISYDGRADAPVSEKIATVSKYVYNMQAMIAKSKSAALAAAQEAQSYRIASNDDLYASVTVNKSENTIQEKVNRRRGPILINDAIHQMSAPPPRSAAPPPMSPRSAAPPPLKASPKSAGSADSRPSRNSSSTATSPPPPAAPVAPQQKVMPEPKPADHPQPLRPSREFGDSNAAIDVVDYTKIPSEMEQKFEELDEDSALRPTIINPGNTWTKRYQKGLLAEPQTMTLSTDEQGKERNKAFDLLDALTKSGGLSVDQASLHVVVAATHCFDKTLSQTVIQDNVNPIEKVERSSLIVASTIHQASPVKMISDQHLERVSTFSPMLLLGPYKEFAMSEAVDHNRNS